MKAHILPLAGKYYGTIVEIDDGPLAGQQIKIWCSKTDGTERPSTRELEALGMSEKEAQQDAYFGDCHWESATSLSIAEVLVKSLELVN